MKMNEKNARGIEVIGRTFVVIGATLGLGTLTETLYLPGLVIGFIWALLPTATITKVVQDVQAQNQPVQTK